MTKKQEKIIKDTADTLFGKLGVQAEVALSVTDDVIALELTTEDTGMLIGYHGETLEALQLILSLCVSKQLGDYHRVSLEIGEYKKNRTDYLKQLVEQTKERVLSQQQPVALPHLKAWERREVHVLLQDDSEVVSESRGEGRDRTLEIRPK